MSTLIDFEMIQRQRALSGWLEDCKRRFFLKFPKIDFESEYWPVKKLYKTIQRDWYFTESFADFKSKDNNYSAVLRCLAAEIILNGKIKSIDIPIKAFRLLKNSSARSVFEISIKDLREIENECLNTTRLKPAMGGNFSRLLSLLQNQIELMGNKGLIPKIGFHIRNETKLELFKLYKDQQQKSKINRSATLDHKIEAFGDALNALYENDKRLSSSDCVAIAVSTLLMCAPSRINEILCLSIDDYISIEDYAEKSKKVQTDELHSAHQMLIITMKGSKGSPWSAKPALNFMIDAFHYSVELIKQHGKRSRMLIEWYQKHPNKLFLPPELEHFRNKNLSRRCLAKIINLNDTFCRGMQNGASSSYFRLLKHCVFKGPDPDINIKRSTRTIVDLLPFNECEKLLLENVHEAMNLCRKVTSHNHYEGDLSKMLCLFDSDNTPYLPGAITYTKIHQRLKTGNSRRKAYKNLIPSLFEKLSITMPKDGKVEYAYIETHDPRRWLTTQALRHGEKLSDVLINKWAKRLKLYTLKNYDYRTDVELASISKMPELNELTDISIGIAQTSKLEERYGLKTDIVTVNNAGVSITSMNRVFESVEDRPIARTSDQIIILYPSQFGICLHQHHEVPCTNYDSCLPCDNNIVVKGHLPSNDKVRERSNLLRKSIIRQLERLITEHNRGIADDQESLAQHMLKLIEKGLDAGQVADHLIDQFNEIKRLLKDKMLTKRLEEAFVAKGFVMRLNDNNIKSGALIKYHNPSYHHSPNLEKALDSHGGREQIERDEEKLIRKFPEFKSKQLGLKDTRNLINEVDEYDKN